MRIQGKLYNSTDKEPLMFANIYTSDSKGTILPSQNGTSSNAAGVFTLDNVDPLGYVTISSVSIGKDIIKVSSLPSTGGVAVYNKKYSTSNQQLPTVTIRPTTKASATVTTNDKPVFTTPDESNKKWLLPVIIGVGLLVIVGSGLAIKKWA